MGQGERWGLEEEPLTPDEVEIQRARCRDLGSKGHLPSAVRRAQWLIRRAFWPLPAKVQFGLKQALQPGLGRKRGIDPGYCVEEVWSIGIYGTRPPESGDAAQLMASVGGEIRECR